MCLHIFYKKNNRSFYRDNLGKIMKFHLDENILSKTLIFYHVIKMCKHGYNIKLQNKSHNIFILIALKVTTNVGYSIIY